MKSSETGIVIVHYSNLDMVWACLESIFAMKNARQYRPIIVDNGAKTSAQPLIKEFGDRITIITLKKNTGFTGANNVGMQWALENLSSDTIIILNDDTTVQESAFEALEKSLIQHPHAGAVVPKIYFSAGSEFHTGYEKNEIGNVFWYTGGCVDWKEVVGFHRGVDEVDRGQYNNASMTQFATGCCIAFRRSALEQVGLFDDKYFLYLEDMDLSERLLRAGWELWYEPAATIWHKNAGSSSSGSSLHVYYQTRNRILYGMKYASWRTRLFLLKHSWNQYRTGSPIIKRAILDAFQNRYGIHTDLHHS